MSKLHYIPHLNHRSKNWIGRAAFGSAIFAACLQAGAASALSFNFTFGGPGNGPSGLLSSAFVTGIIDGLVDNTNGQKTGITLKIISADPSMGPLPRTYTDQNIALGNGFDVLNGQLINAHIRYAQSGVELNLLTAGTSSYSDSFNGYFVLDGGTPPIFTAASPSSASVPGPLPLFGAAAAFGWSRRLRRRIKVSA